jgi:DNA replication and repair protein RecF
MLSPSYRRDFLDETISNINYEYSTILKRYRRLIRQRNSYLKKLSKQFYERGVIAKNDPQLNIWTRQLIKQSAQIYKERINIIKKFEQENFKLQYQFCDKELEKILQAKENIKIIEDLLQESVEDSKKKDIATGYTNIGPHRDDWNIFTDQDIKKYGSRGQKRVAIGNLIFKAHDIIAQEIGYYPTLLLDDIASELDNENRKEIFGKDIFQKQQTFITTVDPDILPSHIKKDAQMINLNEF